MRWPVAIVMMALACVQIAYACELRNPAPVVPDYPPEPPFTERVSDAGRG